MLDIEKVFKGLECLITNKVPCDGCPYYGSGYCQRIVAKDAQELLNTYNGTIEQYKWERDVAIDQLKEIGKGFAEKMDDIVELLEKHESKTVIVEGSDVAHVTRCPSCHMILHPFGANFCYCCGQKVRLDGCL